MGGKKIEGSEEQKRARAREARREGEAPSAVDATTGAPQQRKHLGNRVDHEEKLAARQRGRMGLEEQPDANAGDRPTADERRAARAANMPEPGETTTGPGDTPIQPAADKPTPALEEDRDRIQRRGRDRLERS